MDGPVNGTGDEHSERIKKNQRNQRDERVDCIGNP